MIGLQYRQSLSKFRWSDGSTSVYRNWCKDEPNLENGQCVGFQINPSGTEDRGCFKSIECEEKHAFVCQLPNVNWKEPLKRFSEAIRTTLSKSKTDCHRCKSKLEAQSTLLSSL